MAAFVKTKLKNAREALGKKNYESARDAATEVLSYEPDNYNGHVFLGLAYLELGDTDRSEQAYRKAIELSPEQLLAWQGITKLYERQENWEQYAISLEKVAQLYLTANDVAKCAETLQKFIELRRSKGNPTQLCGALSLLLPESSYYPLLSTLPPPDATNPISTSTLLIQQAMQNTLPILEEIISIVEREEDATFNSEVEKRRTRLGAGGPEQIKKEVRREVWGSSKLPVLYNEILNHPHASDDLRRFTESKLLRYKQQLLHALPSSGDLAARKARIAAELQDLVNGMVLLEIPDEVAWLIYLENKDAAVIEAYDLEVFRKYIRLFPGTQMRNLLYAYLMYSGLSISEDADSDSDNDQRANEEVQDYVETILDAFQSLANSVIAHRIVVKLYQQDGDFENAIKVAESGLELVELSEKNNYLELVGVKKAFNVILATSLVHHFPPKNHTRALRILSDVLANDPDNVPCLMGRAYILQYASKWSEARPIFDRVSALLPNDMQDGIRAKEESAWCTMQLHDPESAAKSLGTVSSVLDGLEGREPDQARCWWRLGQCLWNMGDDGREEAYRHFITSLKRSPTFAPAFTSLGIYYAEYASPPDPKRASKCFQKAFELDPREGDAARRLAEGFAEEREWDLVEVVARRTIDGEGGLNAGLESATARYLPVNAWAWKALGVVEMNRQRYSPAIQAFQIALRTDTEDQLSWLRLGEAYSKAGRYEAAIKALKRAQDLDSDDWIASYFLGDVERQTGQYETAIEIFTDIIIKQPQESKVLLSLAQTHFDLGRFELVSFFTARAVSSFTSSIKTVLRLIEVSPGYRRLSWKIAADALYYLSQLSTFVDTDDVVSTVHQITPLLAAQPREQLAELSSLHLEPDTSSSKTLSFSVLQTALLAYQYRASLGASDDSASGSACYDLGVALSAYVRWSTDATLRDRAQQEAVLSFKKALALDPINDRYWNALGTVLFSTQPRTAQHAYIRALEIDPRNAASWTNLGLFYIHHGDTDLATDAFNKAQVLDPDYALAWVGRGLVAALEGREAEGRAVFEHSTGLPAPILDADVAFATKLVSHLRSARDLGSLDLIYPAFFVLDRYCKQRSHDAYALHLFGLVCESIGHYELGIEVIEEAISILEAAYEENEDPVLERRFTIAHVNIGRLRLSAVDYEGALSSFQVALGLLPDDTDDLAARSLLSQAQLLSGLASFKQGHLEEALQFCELALENSADDAAIRGHVVVVLAQTLWAIGTDEGKESAKVQLLQSIELDPENLLAINALAGMGILTDDDNLVDAALSEILSLSIQERQDRDPEGEVTSLLMQHHLSQGDVAQAISIVQKDVVAQPSFAKNKLQLATLVLQSGETSSAQAVLASLSAEDELISTRDSVALQALVENRSEDQEGRSLRLAKKAVMLAPWREFNWQALAHVRQELRTPHAG